MKRLFCFLLFATTGFIRADTTVTVLADPRFDMRQVYSMTNSRPAGGGADVQSERYNGLPVSGTFLAAQIDRTNSFVRFDTNTLPSDAQIKSVIFTVQVNSIGIAGDATWLAANVPSLSFCIPGTTWPPPGQFNDWAACSGTSVAVVPFSTWSTWTSSTVLRYSVPTGVINRSGPTVVLMTGNQFFPPMGPDLYQAYVDFKAPAPNNTYAGALEITYSVPRKPSIIVVTDDQ